MVNDSSFHKLTEGIDLEAVINTLRSLGSLGLAGDLQILKHRIEKLQKTEPTTADKMDFEKYMAWDIIKEIRRITRCSDERSLVPHCEEVMEHYVRMAGEILDSNDVRRNKDD